MADRLTSREIPFSETLLPSLLKTFNGFSQKHFESILGNRPIAALKANPEYWTSRGLIDFNLTDNDNIHDIIASIRGHIGPEQTFLNIEAYQLNPDHQRGFRLGWFNHKYNTPRGEDVYDLFFDAFQVLPIVGEEYNSYFAKKIKTAMSVDKRIRTWSGSENMHDIKLEKKLGLIRAISKSGEKYPIDVELNNGVYEIKAHADGTTFLHPFSLTFPARIRINPQEFKKTLQLLW